ncbi:hypothetical protein NXU95_15205 [Phocaeicola vulgatus]|nr:hypothetical protein [Phocaeicola vulgatus]
MTVKELFLSVSFDESLPFLEKWESDHLDNIYAFREAYDILRNMKTNIDYHGEVIISCNKENDDQSIEIIRSDDDVWENELAKEVIFKDVNQTDIREIAMQCLWEMTFYGFSPTERNNTFDKMFNGHKPTLRYEIALDRLEESIWKHQTPRRLRHKDKYGRRLTTWDDSRKFLFERRMNRSKRKRDFRQKKREEYLKIMSARETMISILSAPGSNLRYEDVEFIFNIKYGCRYCYNSVTNGNGRRLDYIFESMNKYQQLDLNRYDSAVVFISMPSEYPVDETEMDSFKTNVQELLGYKNILWGNVKESKASKEVNVMLLLNKN